MTKSEFIRSYAGSRANMECYAEGPDGRYEYASHNAKDLVPLVNYALSGLMRKNREVNKRTLDDQFSYVFGQWCKGAIYISETGLVLKTAASNVSIEWQARRDEFRKYIPKDYLDMLEAIRQQVKQQEASHEANTILYKALNEVMA